MCECQCKKIIQSGMHLSWPGIKMQLLTGQFTFGCIRRFPVYSEIYKLLYLLCQETMLSVVGFKISNHSVAKLSSSWQVYLSRVRFTIPLRNKGVWFQKIQDLVFSVKLHLGLILWHLTLIPYPCSLSLSTVPFEKFMWGLFLSMLLLSLLSQVKVKSTPSPRPKSGVWQQISGFWPKSKLILFHS